MPIGAFKLNTLAKYEAPVVSGKTVTLNGGGVISNFVKPPTNGNTWGRSYYNPTASAYVEIAQHNDFAFGTSQDFTVEGFFFFGSTISGKYMFDGRADANSLAILFDGTYLKVYIAGAYRISGALNAVSPNIWHHIAYTRQGTTGTLWWNGNSVGTWTDTTNYTHSNSIKLMSRYVAGQGSPDSYCAGFRISNVARYTTTYSVPTQPWSGDANTLLLLHFDEAAGSTTTQDTSSSAYTPVTYSYDIVPSITSINEEGTGANSNYITYSILGPTQSTTYYFTYELNGVAQTPLPTADLDGSEQFGVTDYASNMAVYAINDVTTEGNQTLVAKMYSDSGRTNLVATSQPVTIVDTSTDPVSLTFIGATYSDGTTTIAMPSGAQAGDIVFVIDRLAAVGSLATFRTPLTSAGTSFTAHQTTSGGSSTTFLGSRISSKVLTGSELGTITNLANNTAASAHRAMAILFRPNSAITSVTYTQTGGEYNVNNPAVQTVSISNQPTASVAMAVYTSGGAVAPRTSSIAMDELVASGVTTFYTKYKLYTSGEARNNFTVDMDDEGSMNLLQSFYVKFN